MVSPRCFLAYMQMLEPYRVDFVPFHSCHSSIVTTPVCQPCLVNRLPSFPVLISSYQAKHPAGKDTCASLK